MMVLFYSGSWSISNYHSWLVSPLWNLTNMYVSLEYIAFYNLTIELISTEGNIQVLRRMLQRNVGWRRIDPLPTQQSVAHLRIRVTFQTKTVIPKVIAAVREVLLLSEEEAGKIRILSLLNHKHNLKLRIYKTVSVYE